MKRFLLLLTLCAVAGSRGPVMVAIQPVTHGIGVVYWAPQGSRCIVQSSSDLTHWTPVQTNIVTSEELVAYIDTNALRQRFYRVVRTN